MNSKMQSKFLKLVDECRQNGITLVFGYDDKKESASCVAGESDRILRLLKTLACQVETELLKASKDGKKEQ